MPVRKKFIYPLLSDFEKIDSVEKLMESDSDFLFHEHMPNGKVSDGEYRLINLLIKSNYSAKFVITNKKEFFYIIKKPTTV